MIPRNNPCGIYIYMIKAKHLFIIFCLLTTCIGCFAQREYSEVKNLFCSNATTHWRLADTEENLGFLLEPLDELKLDENYVLADFRKKWDIRTRPKDISSLRLYVRPAKGNSQRRNVTTRSTPAIWKAKRRTRHTLRAIAVFPIFGRTRKSA